MSNFVGRPPFSNSLWVAIETMQFHIAQTNFFKDTFVSHPGGPNEQFGTHEKLSWGVQGNLNWMPGYWPCILKTDSHLTKNMRGSNGGGGGGAGVPVPTPENSQIYRVSLQYWSRSLDKPSQHSIMDQHRPTSEMPLKWRFADGPIMARF